MVGLDFVVGFKFDGWFWGLCWVSKIQWLISVLRWVSNLLVGLDFAVGFKFDGWLWVLRWVSG